MSSKQSSMKQAVRFGLVGGLNTAVDFVIFFLLYRHLHVYATVAQVLSYSAGAANSYVWNKYFTFGAKQKATKREVFSFLAVNLLSLGVTVLLLDGLREQWGWPALAAKAAATIVGIGMNFIGSKLWVFRQQALSE
ncbi:GtrA family protein [Ectobacillus ponti]|uniref:GtrA family protein n=1 Tax=Ectobacillus ponti TaxID=2961894 RepID=A0AA42BPL8_9BACI|nr:GtrA family protein [Ectobacillus ponti]MCP8968576.1 GtrA family protein [Ectobacillus ponti]